jgi:hypothetical protein
VSKSLDKSRIGVAVSVPDEPNGIGGTAGVIVARNNSAG